MARRTPINSLPPEILIHIFHTILAQPCRLDPYFANNGLDRPSYPDCLTQVCTLWRTIAVSCNTLWCHIDLTVKQPHRDSFVNRAETHLARVGKLPVELHIAMDSTDSHTLGYDNIYRFISLISDRVKSLELTMVGTFGYFHRRIFRLLLCQRPAIIKLVLRSHYDNFLVASSSGYTGEERFVRLLTLDCTADAIESSFASITVLHVHGIFPLWSSKAYHGLVDLRLLSTDAWSRISEAQFVTILESSPGLRILHFGIEIVDSTPASGKVTPVTLRDLQSINIIPSIDGTPKLCPGSVLRLLAPGAKPLRLSIEGRYMQYATMLTELERFFSRSTVTRFYIQSKIPPLNLLLHHSTRLEQIVLDYFEFAYHSQFPSDFTGSQVEELVPLPLPSLKSLYVTRSSLLDYQLHLLLKYCPSGIVLNSCNIYRRAANGRPYIRVSAAEIPRCFPSVRITHRTLYPKEAPTADWDVFD